MKRLFLAFLFTGIALLYFGCSENNPSAPELSQSDQVTNSLAKKPLTGIVYLDFTTNNPPYFWVGTVTFGTETYDLRYLSVGDPPPPPPQAFIFKERFEIYEAGHLYDPNYLVLEGPDAGVMNNGNGNSKFVANGKVEFAKTGGPFEMWLGRNVHIDGIAFLPDYAIGTFRIN